MGKTKEEIQNEYPLPVYNYRVTIDDDDSSPTISFSEVSGLSQEYESVTYKHGFTFLMGPTIVPGMIKYPQITLKRGICKERSYLSDWMDYAYHKSFSSKVKRDITINLCNELGQPLVSWSLTGALPTKLDAPGFDASSNDLAIESMELIARKIRVNYLK